MSIEERSEIKSALYRLQADLGCLYVKCHDARALAIGTYAQSAQQAINDALEEMQPEAPAVAEMEFPRRKY